MATWKTVQEIASGLPATEESTSYGTPALKVKGKLLARLREDDGGLVVYTEEKEALLADDRGIYYTTPHYDGYPTVLLRLPKIGVRELREVLTEAWRIRAPASLRKAHPDL
jgi:hypothetical protein